MNIEDGLRMEVVKLRNMLQISILVIMSLLQLHLQYG